MTDQPPTFSGITGPPVDPRPLEERIARVLHDHNETAYEVPKSWERADEMDREDMLEVARKVVPIVTAEVTQLTAELDALRREAQMDPEELREFVDDARRYLLRCFPEMDRLRLAMLHQNAHVGEWCMPELAKHVLTRLESAHTPREEKPSDVVAARMGELRVRAESAEAARDAAEARAARLEEQVREAYRTVAVRAAERDQLDSKLMSVVVDRFEESLALAEVLGIVDEDGIPPAWPKMVARVNELRTTLRARRALTEGDDR